MPFRAVLSWLCLCLGLLWWTSVQPMLVNEKAVGPRLNPFKELYWKQFGGKPTEEDLRLMDPARVP
ncbi:MAG TPA: hypothetical protein VNU68_35665 [Verrucomicrobiae bacterium]|nr:hypothetical protein [Verrucomicrobiae bacterium]